MLGRSAGGDVQRTNVFARALLKRGLNACSLPESSARVKNLMLTHVVAVSTLQTAEDNRRYDRQYPERDESLVYSLNHLGRIGLGAGDEQRRGEPCGGYAEADRHLLHRACDGACAAGVFFRDVGVYKGIHARVLQRCECPVDESLQQDDPNGGSKTDGRKYHQQNAENQSVGDEHAPIPNTAQKPRHDHFHAHGRNCLGHDEQPGFNRSVAQAYLIEEG